LESGLKSAYQVYARHMERVWPLSPVEGKDERYSRINNTLNPAELPQN
jgi:hypothetical protein